MEVWTAAVLRRRHRQGVARRRGARLLVRRPASGDCGDCGDGADEAGGHANVSGASGEAIGDYNEGDAGQVRGAARGVGGAARDGGAVEVRRERR